jgi:hypothetical protein
MSTRLDEARAALDEHRTQRGSDPNLFSQEVERVADNAGPEWRAQALEAVRHAAEAQDFVVITEVSSMTCSACAHTDTHGWHGLEGQAHCPDCHRSWKSKRAAHCPGSPDYRKARRRGDPKQRGAGGERNRSCRGVSRLPSRQEVTHAHASGRDSRGSYPQSPTVVKRARNVIQELRGAPNPVIQQVNRRGCRQSPNPPVGRQVSS